MSSDSLSASASLKPDRLLHELAQLWTSLSKDGPDAPKGAGVLRACAMTLIVFVDDEADPLVLGETLARLMRAHPSRAIVVRLREDAGVLESRVFAQCWMPFGHNRQICCEQVEISVSINRMGDIPSIVSPLAAADVPRVVWFRATRMDDVPNIGKLLAPGDKIVVDSARPGAPGFADLRALANAGFVIGDLAWTRLTKLRQLIAQLLNGRDLKTVANVTLEYSGSAHADGAYRGNDAPAGVKYLRAWLRSQLESAEVELRRIAGSGVPRLKAIRISPDIHIRAEENCVEYETGGLRQRANIPECDESALLSEELNIMSHDDIFERALQRMTAWTPKS
ncbi:MAG: glucose-6-phosphate dehydrogenase assembly protein OpcA [Acidobacteriota bacterium]|nr:glucose-6-phosphate dehydrogenase assembly protein OpcA [Acidobacteriota bacterium]